MKETVNIIAEPKIDIHIKSLTLDVVDKVQFLRTISITFLSTLWKNT